MTPTFQPGDWVQWALDAKRTPWAQGIGLDVDLRVVRCTGPMVVVVTLPRCIPVSESAWSGIGAANRQLMATGQLEVSTTWLRLANAQPVVVWHYASLEEGA